MEKSEHAVTLVQKCTKQASEIGVCCYSVEPIVAVVLFPGFFWEISHQIMGHPFFDHPTIFT